MTAGGRQFCCWLRRGIAAAVLGSGVLSRAQPDLPPQLAVPPGGVPASAPPYRAPENPAELLKLDDEMRTYFARRIPRRGGEYVRLRDIVQTILQPDGLNFAYDADATYDARETFRRRRGNCASFSFLVVAVAREHGFDASFQCIERTSRWSRAGNMVLAIAHLNVRVATTQGEYTVDLEPEVTAPREPSAARRISDENAAARFYCNVGVEHLVRSEAEASLRYLVLATTVDPRCASAWANRAAVHARLGDFAAAKASYEQSLRADPRGDAAMDGFVDVLRRLGTPEDLQKAQKLERRARAIRQRNPYYHEYLASRAYGQHDLAGAERLLRRAISLKDDEPQFYIQWIAVLKQLGRNAEADRATARLDRLQARLAASSELVLQ